MIMDYGNQQIKSYSRNLVCPSTGISYPDPEPNLFSFNSPYGACQKCNGLGTLKTINFKKVIPDSSKSIKNGGIEPLGPAKKNWIFKEIENILESNNLSLHEVIYNIDEHTMSLILNGTNDLISNEHGEFEGVLPFLKRQSQEGTTRIKRWADTYTRTETCRHCKGSRLNENAHYFKIKDKNIAEISDLSMNELQEWTKSIESTLSKNLRKIATEILKEINTRLQFILDVGLQLIIGGLVDLEILNINEEFK